MYDDSIAHIGQWYSSEELGVDFEVVATDGDHNQDIAIQFVDGNIEMLDSEAWKEIHSHAIAAPDDWSSPYEIVHEDLDRFMDDISQPNSWNSPLDSIEPVELNDDPFPD